MSVDRLLTIRHAELSDGIETFDHLILTRAVLVAGSNQVACSIWQSLKTIRSLS